MTEEKAKKPARPPQPSLPPSPPPSKPMVGEETKGQRPGERRKG